MNFFSKFRLKRTDAYSMIHNMKRKALLSATLIASLAFITACDPNTKDIAHTKLTTTTTTAPAPTTTSTLPVEIGTPLVITAPTTVAPTTKPGGRGGVAPTTATTAKPVTPTAPEVIMEDDPRWNCATMGNKICGPAPEGFTYAEDGSLVPNSFYETQGMGEEPKDTQTYCWEILETDTSPYVFGCTGLDGVPQGAINVAPWRGDHTDY